MTSPSGAPSLKILSGPQSGSATELDPADETLLGSDSSCHLQIDTLSPIQARIRWEPEGFVVYDARSPLGIWLNDDRVSDRAVLHDGDILWLGAPGGADSVMVQCRLAAHSAGDDFIVDPVAAPADVVAADEFVVATDPARTPAPFTVEAAEAEVFFVDDTTAPPPPRPAPVDEEPFFVADETSADPWAPPPTVDSPLPPTVEPAPPVEPPRVFTSPVPPPAEVPNLPPDPPPVVVSPPVAVPPAPAPAPTAPRPPRPPSAPRPSAPRAASPAPASARTAPRPAASGAAATPRRGGGGGVPVKLVAAIVAGVVVLGVAVAAALYFMGTPSVTGVQPERVRVGETVTITGQNLAGRPSENEVRFGDVPARVIDASPTEIKVEVPAMRLVPGQDTPVSLRVRSGGREADALSITVFTAPSIARLTPDVAMPGEEVTIEGGGWKDAADVRFGSQSAQVMSAAPAAGIRVRVPEIAVAPGTSVPVVVTVSGVDSQPATFVLGRLPLVLGTEPARAMPGDAVVIKGRGFAPDVAANRVLVAGVPALVATAGDSELKILLPRSPITPEGTAVVEVHVEGRPEPGLAQIAVTPPADVVELRLFAEPMTDAAGHLHAVLGTDIGPSFVLSDAGGKSAALRALEMIDGWNAAVARLRASLDDDIEARHLDSSPVLALKGRPQVIVEVTGEDAAGYNEGWVKADPKAPLVTPARLAVWWEAQARDLVLLVLRGRAPEHTTALSPEGRPLAEVHGRARKTGRFGVPRDVVAGLKPAEREALRAVGLRVPATITVSGDRGASAAAASAAGVRLEGTWIGHEREQGRRRNISVTFEGERGTLTYQAGVALSMPLAKVEQPQKGVVKFSAMIRGGVRHYTGRWDGEKMTGTITQEGATPPEVGTFELGR